IVARWEAVFEERRARHWRPIGILSTHLDVASGSTRLANCASAASLSGLSARVMLPCGVAAGRSRLDPGYGRQGLREVALCCTTKLENTHETEFRELLYPWHPWFGLRVGIHSTIENCSLRGSDADRWPEAQLGCMDDLFIALVLFE